MDASRRFAATFSRPAPEDASFADGLGRVTIRSAAQMCSVSPATVNRWVSTGLWPIPSSVCRGTCFFDRSDVEGWLACGSWPAGAYFREQRTAQVGAARETDGPRAPNGRRRSSERPETRGTVMSVNIKLRGGPCDGERHNGVRDRTRRVTRSSRAPGAVYDVTDEYDPEDGRRVFVYREAGSSGRD